MDFHLTPEEEVFRDEVRSWLQRHLPKGWPDHPPYRTERERTEFLKNWQRQLGAAKLAGIAWPREYGGRGATLMEQVIFNEEMAKAKAPPMINIIGLHMAGPTIMVHGTEEQKRRFLPKIISGEEIWCQGFSEPNAGSDLAALQTRAVRDGDDYVITGQKVWTSWGHQAHWCLLLTRTDPDLPKHKGLTMFLVDMHSPGVEVRPLVQMTGEAEFNEVFFDHVRVPKANMLGKLNDGWNVAITTLMYERGTTWRASWIPVIMEELLALARTPATDGMPPLKDPLMRQRVAQMYIETQALRLTYYRNLTRLMRGEVPGSEGSIIKLHASELHKRITDTAIELEGMRSQVLAGSPWTVRNGYWQREFLWAPASTIAAGTSEIQKNILAERVLGLPKDR
ncbi:MAG TPA: acyl-CoA dehydrogenase [Alphaproteobacteria bacterium]|nr:acyl-CoA dehydrogenase [Alphaproteobacteria bacterium]